MSVLVVGISHKSAPVELLERLALVDDGVAKLLGDVVDGEHITEATAIATCNAAVARAASWWAPIANPTARRECRSSTAAR